MCQTSNTWVMSMSINFRITIYKAGRLMSSPIIFQILIFLKFIFYYFINAFYKWHFFVGCNCTTVILFYVKYAKTVVKTRKNGIKERWRYCTYIHNIHIFNIFPARLRIIEYIQGVFCCLLELNYYLHGSNILVRTRI